MSTKFGGGLFSVLCEGMGAWGISKERVNLVIMKNVFFLLGVGISIHDAYGWTLLSRRDHILSGMDGPPLALDHAITIMWGPCTKQRFICVAGPAKWVWQIDAILSMSLRGKSSSPA